MKTFTTVLTLLTTVCAGQILFAQGAPGAAEQHEFLKKFVGEWDAISKGKAGEGQPPMLGKAITRSTMLGDLWVVNSSDMEVGGFKMKSIQMIGYDTRKKKYVGIWADSMINHMWHYEGTVDESGKKLTLNTKGPSMTGDGKTLNYRDAYEFADDDTILATSLVEGPDGKWNVMMTGTITRRKK